MCRRRPGGNPGYCYLAVILDLGLPNWDGMTVLSFIRDKGLTVPMLVLTSRDGKQAVIEGLNGEQTIISPSRLA